MSKDNKLTQKLRFLNGFRVIRDNYNSDDACNANFVDHNPVLTYGQRTRSSQLFIPHYVRYDGKQLSFHAYFRQGIIGSADEHFRVRRVNLVYYLEDDTMAVLEPRVENAGFAQGKLVARSRIPKSDTGYYHWKDLNVGLDIGIYGVIYRVIDCNAFTREFLTSQGIDVGIPENLPSDPYQQNRILREQSILQPFKEPRIPLEDDRRLRYLEYDGMVLTFDTVWDDHWYKIRYFLADNTITISKHRKPNESKETCESKMLLKRTKVPKNWKDLPSNYPNICTEKNDADVMEYLSPSDFKIGDTVFIFGRRFFVYDCDPFTRKYYSEMLGIEQPPRIQLPEECIDTVPKTCRESERPSQDLIRKLYNFPKCLRYTMEMDTVHPEDKGREFVLEYSLADGALRITEIGRRNSGRMAGRFLGWTRVPKPGSAEYYSPEDFRIGDRINIFERWFRITGTEVFVYNYMMANPQKFEQGLKDNIKNYLQGKGLIEEEIRKKCQDDYEPIEDRDNLILK